MSKHYNKEKQMSAKWDKPSYSKMHNNPKKQMPDDNRDMKEAEQEQTDKRAKWLRN